MQMLFEFQPDEYLVSVKQPQEWLEQSVFQHEQVIIIKKTSKPASEKIL